MSTNCRYIIYMHTHAKTKLSYVGVTKKAVQQRLNKHFREARHNTLLKSKFHRAIRKAKFDRSIWNTQELYVCDNAQEAYRAEVELIKTYDTFHNGYNTTPGGNVGPVLKGKENGMFGKKRPKSLIKRMVAASIAATKGKTYEQIHGIEKAQQLKLQRSVSVKTHRTTNPPTGTKNSNAKQYHLTDPQGNVHIVEGQLRVFCKQHSLEITAVIDTAKGRRPNYKGWRIEIVGNLHHL